MPGPLSNAHTVTKLPAQDLERARRFDRDKLGLEPIEERTGALRYACGPTEFHLFSSAGAPSGESTQMAFKVENLGAIVADLRARGVTFERFEMSGFDVRGDTIAGPDNYPSKPANAGDGSACSCWRKPGVSASAQSFCTSAR